MSILRTLRYLLEMLIKEIKRKEMSKLTIQLCTTLVYFGGLLETQFRIVDEGISVESARPGVALLP